MMEHTLTHVYPGSCEALERAFEQELFSRGYALKRRDGRVLETEWGPIPDSVRERRYLIQLVGQRVGAEDATCRALFLYQDQALPGEALGAWMPLDDWRMPLRVMERRDPAGAARLKEGAAAARQCARQGVDCGGAE